MTPASPRSVSNPRLQIAWDNHSLDLLKTCPRKYQYVMEGWGGGRMGDALQFGILHHAGTEYIDRLVTKLPPDSKEDHRDALAIAAARWALENSTELDPLDGPRSRKSLARVLVDYADIWALAPTSACSRLINGQPALELSFAVPLGLETLSGESYVYCGHVDKVSEFEGGHYLVEKKHTITTLSPGYFKRYINSSQVTGYKFGLEMTYHQPIRGAFLEATQVGVTFSRTQRFIINRSPELIDEWIVGTATWLRWAESLASSDADYPMNQSSCADYGGCAFLDICTKPPGVRQRFLEGNFQKTEPWNPLISRGTTNE